MKNYDYSQGGAYFFTICTWSRECIFADIIDAHVEPSHALTLTPYGEVVASEWLKTPNIRSNVELDEFIVMPNHIHGILIIEYAGTEHRAPTYEQFAHSVSGSFPTIIRSFKTAVTKRINEIRNTPGRPVWQRNYYEHVIRDENDLNRIREYIINNPARWSEDENNPFNAKP